jgi:hypothetical protein
MEMKHSRDKARIFALLRKEKQAYDEQEAAFQAFEKIHGIGIKNIKLGKLFLI